MCVCVCVYLTVNGIVGAPPPSVCWKRKKSAFYFQLLGKIDSSFDRVCFHLSRSFGIFGGSVINDWPTQFLSFVSTRMFHPTAFVLLRWKFFSVHLRPNKSSSPLSFVPTCVFCSTHVPRLGLWLQFHHPLTDPFRRIQWHATHTHYEIMLPTPFLLLYLYFLHLIFDEYLPCCPWFWFLAGDGKRKSIPPFWKTAWEHMHASLVPLSLCTTLPSADWGGRGKSCGRSSRIKITNDYHRHRPAR